MSPYFGSIFKPFAFNAQQIAVGAPKTGGVVSDNLTSDSGMRESVARPSDSMAPPEILT